MNTARLLIAVLSALAFAPAAFATPTPTESGLVEGVAAGAVTAFKGIPYAAPPTGDLRWRAPAPAIAWDGVRQADVYSPACPQKGVYPPETPVEPTSEDCLTLNIWTPDPSPDAKLPVMVWIHGGGLVNGSGSAPVYAGDRLAARGVVVVTINYRLGALGFLAHPELNAESNHGGSGNYGLLDQIAALQWVRRNIAAFGGDPDAVTIFGQSSGAFSVSMLVASPLARGLFRRAIAESGGVFEPVELDGSFSPAGASASGERFADRAGEKTLAQLRAMPVSELLDVRFSPQFNIDGYVLTKAPYDAYVAGEIGDVDILVGSNSDEGLFFLAGRTVTVENFDSVLSETFPGWLIKLVGAKPGATDAEAQKAASEFDGDMRFRWDMWTWARLAAKRGRHVYFYQFDGAPAYGEGRAYHGLGATHGVELPFVFDKLDEENVDLSPANRGLATTIPAYWTNFAKTGDPNGEGLPLWPEFAMETDKVMLLGDSIGVTAIPRQGRLKRIDQVYSTARFVAANPAAAGGAGLAIVITVLALLVWLLRRLFVRRR